MVSSRPSFGNHSSASIPWMSREEQIRTMYDTVQNERGGRDLAIIAVVTGECLKKLRKKMKKRSWKFWRVRSRVLVTTMRHLKETVHEVSKDSKVRSLTIMVCEGVPEIYFKVQSPNIETLKILRCGQQAGEDGNLVIRGGSKFDGTRLDEWESRPHPDARLYFGQGVRIRVNLDRDGVWSESRSDISWSEQQDIKAALNKMQQTNKEGTWWDQWKGYVSTIVGILIAGTKFFAGGSASASGYCCSFRYRELAFDFAKGCFSASAIATSTGPAIALGAVAGLAVYLVPWDEFLPWLNKAMSSWGTWAKSLWERFWSWWNGSSEETHCNPGKFRNDFM